MMGDTVSDLERKNLLASAPGALPYETISDLRLRQYKSTDTTGRVSLSDFEKKYIEALISNEALSDTLLDLRRKYYLNRVGLPSSSLTTDDLRFLAESGITSLPKTQTVVDTFNSSINKATLWVASSTQTVWDASGRAKIPCTTSYYNLGTENVGNYTLTSSYFFAKVVVPSAGSLSRETFMEVVKGGTSNYKLGIAISGNDIFGYQTINGVRTNYGTIPYNSTTHAWLRIREASGTAYFDVSSDGVTWNSLGSVAVGFDLSRVWLNFISGYWGTESAADTYIDNINTVPPALSIVGSTQVSDAAATTTLTPTLPAGLQTGDRLYLLMMNSDAAAGAVVTPTVPAGWTAVSAIADQGTMQRALYSADYTAGLNPVTWASSAARKTGYICVAVRGLTQAHVTAVANEASSTTSSTFPTATATKTGIAVRLTCRKDNLSVTPTLPAAHTLIGQAIGQPTGPSVHLVACQTPAAVGALAAAAVTWSVASLNSTSWTILVA